jgi:serine/threonine protein phosphatase 1
VGSRLLAIGDIHGHAKALAAMLKQIQPRLHDTLVILGDCVDRGPDTQGVIDQLLALEEQCHLVTIMGNHEEMMLAARERQSDYEFWVKFGGDAAMDSYGPGRTTNVIPKEHWAFMERLPLYYETDAHFFVHANYAANQYLKDQHSQTLLWLDLADLPGQHFSGKTAVVGHTPQTNGQVLDLGYLKCIDTFCGHGGLLTALDVGSGQIWQVTESGNAKPSMERVPCHVEARTRPHDLAGGES